jgi:hypothetical protein
MFNGLHAVPSAGLCANHCSYASSVGKWLGFSYRVRSGKIISCFMILSVMVSIIHDESASRSLCEFWRINDQQLEI